MDPEASFASATEEFYDLLARARELRALRDAREREAEARARACGQEEEADEMAELHASAAAGTARASAHPQRADVPFGEEHAEAAGLPSDADRVRVLETRARKAELETAAFRLRERLREVRHAAEAESWQKRSADAERQATEERLLKSQAVQQVEEERELKLQAVQQAEQERTLKLKAELQAQAAKSREERAQQRAVGEVQRADRFRREAVDAKKEAADLRQVLDNQRRCQPAPPLQRNTVSLPPRQRETEVSRDHRRGWGIISSFIPPSRALVQQALFDCFTFRGDVLGYTVALHWLTTLRDESIDWDNYSEWESFIWML